MADDNRDIFDKAIDNAPSIGAVAGAVGGARTSRKYGTRAMRAIGMKATRAKRLAQMAIAGGAGAYLGAEGGKLAATRLSQPSQDDNTPATPARKEAPVARRAVPKQETESAQEDMAEGGEGGEGDAEDNRDIFDKALDWAPTAGTIMGAIMGGRIGRKAGAQYLKKANALEVKINKLKAKNASAGLTNKEHLELNKAILDHEHMLQNYGGNMAGRFLVRAPIGAVVGGIAGSAAKDAGQKRRK